MGLEDRIESEMLSTVPIRNKNLECRDCVYKFDDSVILAYTSKCAKYVKMKPKKVLYGGKCEEYKKE